MTPRVASLALRLLRRAHRAGELRVLLASIAVAVASVTAVGFFTDRVNRVLETQGAELLGADLVLRSDDPIPRDWVTEARQFIGRIPPPAPCREREPVGKDAATPEAGAWRPRSADILSADRSNCPPAETMRPRAWYGGLCKWAPSRHDRWETREFGNQQYASPPRRRYTNATTPNRRHPTPAPP